MNSPVFWLKYLPSAIRVKIEHRPNLLRILENTGWLFFDKILRMGMGLLVGVWVARYLGPEQFGLFNYATAIVALFTAVGSLGLNGIVVRDLVKAPNEVGSTLGTAFVLQLIGGFLACILAVAAVMWMRPTDGLAKVAVAILGLSMIFKSTEVIKYWFESVVQSKYAVWVENLAFLIFAGTKVALILMHASLMAFVWVVLAEAVLVAMLLVFVYSRHGHVFASWKFRLERAKTLMQDAWPLVLSGLAAMIYMRIDQVMLGQMKGDLEVGVYSAALRLSEVWYFIPMAIASSVFPSIIAAREKDVELYYSSISKLFNLMVLLALIVAIPISFLSQSLMHLLYGEGYGESAKVLVIHVWSGLFVFLGVASSRWFVSENLQRYTFYRTMAGCLVNVILNLWLIPVYGAVGAAWASVVSQAIASVLFNAVNAKTRHIFVMQMGAVLCLGFGGKFNAK